MFVFAWALAHLAHLIKKAGDTTYGHALDDPLAVLVFVATLALLAKPSDYRRLAAMAATQIVHLAAGFPHIENHWVIAGTINLGLLTALASTWYRARRPDITSTFPFARTALTISYGAAAIAKLNSGFFHPDHSCAITMFAEAVTPYMGLEPPAVMPILITGTELAIPLLLIIPRTRSYGVTIAVLLHLGMTASPLATAQDFTVALFALLILFLPAGASHLALDRVRLLADRHPWVTSPAALVTVAIGLTAVAIGGADLIGHRPYRYGGRWLLPMSIAAVMGVALLVLTWKHRDHAGQILKPRQHAHWVLIGLLVANAAAPYLGGKTISSFTMYSNLQTAQGFANHYLVPRLPIEARQDDLVEILEATNPRLQRRAGGDVRITWHELRRTLANDPTASITYRRDGRLVELERADQDGELVMTDPIMHRLIGHRPVDTGPPRCRW